MDESVEPQRGSEKPPIQFSLKTLFAVALIVLLLAAYATRSIQAYRTKSELVRQNARLQYQIDHLENRLEGALGQQLRTQYAERILLHVTARPKQYAELTQALHNQSASKVGISLHPLGEKDGLTYVNIYSMTGATDGSPFCHSFVVTEEPFDVVDYISGGQSRLPRMHDGSWTCGAGKEGRDCWYRITSSGFEPLESEPAATISTGTQLED